MAEHTFKIVDGNTGNPVGHYAAQSAAVGAFQALLTRYPADREHLVLVEVDKSGMPVESWLAENLDQLAALA